MKSEIDIQKINMYLSQYKHVFRSDPLIHFDTPLESHSLKINVYHMKNMYYEKLKSKEYACKFITFLRDQLIQEFPELYSYILSYDKTSYLDFQHLINIDIMIK